MFKQTLSIILIGLILNLVFYPLNIRANQSQDDKEAKFIEKIKLELNKIGIGSSAKVTVKLKDGTKLKGYVSEVKDDYVVVKNEKYPPLSNKIQFSEIKQFKAQKESLLFWGRNSPKRALVATLIFITVMGILVARSDF